MKTILITGNSGYIGSHLCSLLKDEYTIHGIDYNDPQVEIDKFYKIDITKPFSIEGMVYDAVIHLAALVNVGESEQRPISYYITNLNGTMNVLNKVKAKHFIFASTGAAEGCASAYGISKRAAEDVVRSYTKMADMDYTIFRFYNVIGSTVVPPTNTDGLMYNLMKAKESGEFTIFGNDYSESWDGTCVRDYVHVADIAQAHISVISQSTESGVYNLCSNHGVSNRQIIEAAEKITGRKLSIVHGTQRPGDPPILTANSRKFDMTVPGWRKYTLDDMIQHAWNWYVREDKKV